MTSSLSNCLVALASYLASIAISSVYGSRRRFKFVGVVRAEYQFNHLGSSKPKSSPVTASSALRTPLFSRDTVTTRARLPQDKLLPPLRGTPTVFCEPPCLILCSVFNALINGKTAASSPRTPSAAPARFTRLLS